MKIRKLHLKNIGVFDDEVIEFQPCPDKDKAEIHILTGENGTGKSTILMALATVFCGLEDTQKLDHNSLHKRFRFYEEDGKESFISQEETAYKSQIKAFLNENDKVKLYLSYPYIQFGYSRSSRQNIRQYREWASIPKIHTNKFEFAVFAYSGYRHIESTEITSIGVSSKTNPLLGSLDFIKTVDQTNGLTINNWIADSISKSAVEKLRDPQKSERFASAVRSLENAIEEITGWKVEFDLKTDPFDLRLKLNNQDLDFDVLPDGLRSLISWIGDLLMRVDSLKWNDDLPAFEKNLILFLDEIEVHLHPAWQRKVLPVVQKLFKNSQIFLSTHSPFVVNSVDGAWVYELKVENGKAKVAEITESKSSYSYPTVLREVFGIDERFGGKTQYDLDKFYHQRDLILQANGSKHKLTKEKFLRLAKKLALQSAELQSIVSLELMQLSKRTGNTYEL